MDEFNRSKLKKPEEMATDELRDWILWAEDEVREYRDFIDELKTEWKKR